MVGKYKIILICVMPLILGLTLVGVLTHHRTKAEGPAQPVTASKSAAWPSGQVAAILVDLNREPAKIGTSYYSVVAKSAHQKVVFPLKPLFPYVSQQGDPPSDETSILATVIILYERNTYETINIYATGKNPLLFSINGVKYLCGGRKSGEKRLREHNMAAYGIDRAWIDEATAFCELLAKNLIPKSGEQKEKGG